MNVIGIITVSPFPILPVPHISFALHCIIAYIYSLDLVMEDPIAPHERFGEWDDIGLRGLSDGTVDGRVHPERFADDGVEVLEGVEVVHRRRVVRERPEFLAELGLDCGIAGRGRRASMWSRSMSFRGLDADKWE
jgi:hypothetical protein